MHTSKTINMDEQVPNDEDRESVTSEDDNFQQNNVEKNDNDTDSN